MNSRVIWGYNFDKFLKFRMLTRKITFILALISITIQQSLAACTNDAFCTDCTSGSSCAQCTDNTAEASRFRISQSDGTCYAYSTTSNGVWQNFGTTNVASSPDNKKRRKEDLIINFLVAQIISRDSFFMK